MSATRPRAPRRHDDERGAALPLVALVVVTLLTAAAIAVDLGALAATNRRLQGVADLAAIAGAAELIGAPCNYSYTAASEAVPSSVFNHVRAAVVANAAKNSFAVGGTKTLVIEVGTISYTAGAPTFTSMFSSANGGDCTTSSVPTAVRVTAGDFTRYAFGQVVGQSGRNSQRSGTASRGGGSSVSPMGGFTIGSSVADLDSESSPVLSRVLNGMVCRGTAGCSFSTSLAGYQGLATAGVTLGQLQAQLGAGSVTSLLNSSIRVRDLYLASAKALGCTSTAGCSNTAAVTLLNLSSTVTSTATFKLADMISVASGGEAAAAASTFNVLGLVVGSAQVINGTNTVSVPVTTVTVPGATSTTLSVKVTELPRTYIGPVGGSVSTSQAEVTASQQLNLTDIPLTGSLLGNLATVTGTLPTRITAGSATGTLTEVECTPERGEVVSVDTKGATAAIGDTNTANRFLDVRVAGIRVAGLNVNTTAGVTGVNGNQLSFSYPDEYFPATTTPRHVGGTTLNVQGAALNSSLDVVGLSIDTAVLTNRLTGPTGVVTTLDRRVVSPVLRALGITVGGADVWAIGAPTCSAPTLGA